MVPRAGVVVRWFAVAAVLGPSSAAAFDSTVPCDGNQATGLITQMVLANVTPGVDTIRLVEECQVLFNTAASTAADGSPTALLVTDSVILVGNGATLARSSTEGTLPFRLISVSAGASLTLSGLTLRDGLSRGDPGQSGATPGGAYTLGGVYGGRGGAILSAGTLIGSQLRFESNRAEGGAGGNGFNGSAGGGGGAGLGGAVHIAGGGGSLTRCVFAGNVAAGGQGGSLTGGFPGSQAGAGGGPGGRGAFYDGVTSLAGEPGMFGGGGGGQSFGTAGGGVGGFGGGGGGTWFGLPTGTTYGGSGGAGGFGGGGGGGLGGGLFLGASFTISNCTFSGNDAIGGTGGGGGGGGSGAGGNVFVQAGTATISFTTLVDGAAFGGNAPGGGNAAAGGNGIGGNVAVDGGLVVLGSTIVADGELLAGLGGDGGPAGTTANPDYSGAFASLGFNLVRTRWGQHRLRGLGLARWH